MIKKLKSLWNKLLYKLMFKNYIEKPKVVMPKPTNMG